MDEAPEAPENAPLVRYGFAAIFTAACLYDLQIGVRVAGVFLLGLSVYEAILGRVPLMGPFSWKTRGYLTGAVATALIAGMVFLSMFLILAPAMVIDFLAALSASNS